MSVRIFLPTVVLTLFILLQSCQKDDPGSGQVTMTIMEYGNTEDINHDTIFLASDYSFFGKAMVESSNLSKVRYMVLYDGNEITSTSYTPQSGGTGFLVDSIMFEIKYELLAPAINHITLMVEATSGDGQVTRGFVVYRLQPLNYPFQFRFFDFNSSDTLEAGSNLTIRPFYSPLTPDDMVNTMKVYRKFGFGSENLVDTFVKDDFFFFQTGFLREFGFQVPSIPAGTSIVHRFEMKTSKSRTHVIQHTILVK